MLDRRDDLHRSLENEMKINLETLIVAEDNFAQQVSK